MRAEQSRKVNNFYFTFKDKIDKIKTSVYEAWNEAMKEPEERNMVDIFDKTDLINSINEIENYLSRVKEKIEAWSGGK